MILDKLGSRTLALAAAAAGVLAGCADAHGPPPPSAAESDKLVVACTISTLCSLVQSVGGDRITVNGIVPVGASPETFEPTPSDVVALSHARVLFENGLGLETWLAKLLTSAAPPDLRRVVLSDAVSDADKASGNPHLWMDPVYAAAYVRTVQAALGSADAQHAAVYRANADAELGRLGALHAWIRKQIDAIPPARRTMICFHDAWFYFDRRYGIEDVGAIEPLPGQEPSAGYFAHLIALAKAHHVRAVFGEPQYSPKLAAALQSEAGIRVFTNLYDDTLGASPAVSSYESMMRYDVHVIVTALRS